MSNLTIDLIKNALVLVPKRRTKQLLSGVHISCYANDNFNYVCRVSNNSSINKWNYCDIDENIMFESHFSWLYFITVDDIIYKIGETSKPLGIRSNIQQIQPSTGSSSRLGRYIDGDGTDRNLRAIAQEYLELDHNISFYAKKIDVIDSSSVVGGEIVQSAWTAHKDQELQYLDHYVSLYKNLPEWNKVRK